MSRKRKKTKNRTSRLDSCYQMSQLTKFEFCSRWIQPDFYVREKRKDLDLRESGTFGYFTSEFLFMMRVMGWL